MDYVNALHNTLYHHKNKVTIIDKKSRKQIPQKLSLVQINGKFTLPQLIKKNK